MESRQFCRFVVVVVVVVVVEQLENFGSDLDINLIVS